MKGLVAALLFFVVIDIVGIGKLVGESKLKHIANLVDYKL